MTDPNAQNQQQTPQGGSPWVNPMDAPPPFPNAAAGNPSSNPYASNPYSAPYSSNSSGGNPYGQLPPTYSQIPSRQYGGHVDGDDRMWAMLAHLSAPIAAIVSAGWLTFLGPLIVWLVKKDSSPFVRNAAAGAFNFSITMALISILGWILNFTVILSVIGIPLVLLGGLGAIVLGVVGAIKSWNGVAFTYPFQFKILS